MMQNNITDQAKQWVVGEESTPPVKEFYCETRDIFQTRLDKMISFLLQENNILSEHIYMLGAIAGEIGNNSFDHNLGNWPNVMGIFFSYEVSGENIAIVLADRGRGVFKTLKKVKPEIKTDSDALFTAFNEKISGRAPEPRGNGLKFVKENIKEQKMHLTFYSGTAKIELNNKMEISQTEQQINGCLAIISL